MSLQPLLYVPHVYPGEVMLAYLLRLSEENGYTNPADILRYAGLQGRHGAGIPAPKALQEVFGWSEKQLEMASQHLLALNGKQPKHELLGHVLGSLYVKPWRPKVCPACIRERGHHLPEWHLTYLIACPKHRCLLVTHCNRCRKALRWFRPALLVCQCGASIEESSPADAPQSVVRLGDLLVRKLLGKSLHTSPAAVAGYPMEPMERISLGELLRVICQLGRTPSQCRQVTSRANDTNGIASQLEIADSVFSRWPDGWFEYLDSVQPLKTPYRKESTGVRRRYGAIYIKMFYGRYRGKGIEFMYRALINHALKQTDFTVDKRLLKNLGDSVQGDDWHGVYECAKLLDIDHRAIHRLAQKGAIKTRTVIRGRGVKLLLKIDGMHVDKTHHSILRERDAASYLCMPVRVFKKLCERNLYIDPVIRSDARGYAKSSLDQLKSNLIAGLPKTTKRILNWEIYTTLGAVLRNKKGKENIKADFVQAVLERSVKGLRRIDREPSNIVISSKEVDDFFCLKRTDYYDGLTLTQTASLIGGDCASVKALIKRNLLNGRQAPGRWIVDRAALRAFRARFIWTGEIAKELQTTSKTIVRVASASRFEVITVPLVVAGQKCHFISRADAKLLKKTLSRKGRIWSMASASN